MTSSVWQWLALPALATRPCMEFSARKLTVPAVGQSTAGGSAAIYYSWPSRSCSGAAAGITWQARQKGYTPAQHRLAPSRSHTAQRLAARRLAGQAQSETLKQSMTERMQCC